jgi:hypothetical protein
MNFGKLLKRLWKFAINNYFISIFLACIVFVVLVSGYRLFFTKPTFVYAKVKVGQGLWWASTQKPSVWFVNALKKGGVEKDLIGNPAVKILKVQYYSWGTSSQYDVYLTLKLKVSSNKKTGTYGFNRETIGVGAPIDLEFPSTQVSGTIIQLSKNPLIDEYVEKIIYLNKRSAYPWEYEAIKVGDKYFDGVSTIFEVLDKKATDTVTLTGDSFGNYDATMTETRKYVIVKVKIKVKRINNQLFFSEDQLVNIGKPLSISTPNFSFQDYIIGGIE